MLRSAVASLSGRRLILNILSGLKGDMEATKQSSLLTAGGRIRCLRCQARSKGHGGQCGAPAIQGKRVCRNHGGLSRGPTTAAGRQRCAEAKTIHGEQTRAKRKRASELSALLKAYAAILEVRYRTELPK